MTTPIDVLSGGTGERPWPLFVHAHPDDETLETGQLLAWLATHDVPCDVVTCTRGEQGEIVEGVLPGNLNRADLVRVRERELACAVERLGVGAHYYLGVPPARRDGVSPRRYRDSGMRWVVPGLAGPIDSDDQSTFTAADLEEPVADLVALIERSEANVVVGYDKAGSYGHPDHVRAHQVTVEATRRTGVRFVEVASGPQSPGFTWFDLSDQRAAVVDALRCHATQFTVHDDHLVHVGGQRQELPLQIGLRTVPLG